MEKYHEANSTLVVIVCGLSGSGMCQYSAVFSSYHGDGRYDFPITPEQLAKTPAWLDDQPNPPLPARRALEIAVVHLEKFFANGDEWRRGPIELVPVADRWVYLIEFSEPPPSGCLDCLSMPFRIVVMMDGAVVSAIESPWKPQTPTH